MEFQFLQNHPPDCGGFTTRWPTIQRCFWPKRVYRQTILQTPFGSTSSGNYADCHESLAVVFQIIDDPYELRYFESGVGRPLPKGFNFPWPNRLTRYRPGFLDPSEKDTGMRKKRQKRRRREQEEGDTDDSEEGTNFSNKSTSRLP